MNPYKERFNKIKTTIKVILKNWQEKRKEKSKYIEGLRKSNDVEVLFYSSNELLEIYKIEEEYADECKIEMEHALEILEEVNILFSKHEKLREKLAYNLKLMVRDVFFFIRKDDDVSFLLKLMHGKLKGRILQFISTLDKLKASIHMQVNPTNDLKYHIQTRTIQSNPSETMYFEAIDRHHIEQLNIIKDLNTKSILTPIKFIAIQIFAKLRNSKLQLTGTTISAGPYLLQFDLGPLFFFMGMFLTWSYTFKKWNDDRELKRQIKEEEMKELKLKPHQ